MGLIPRFTSADILRDLQKGRQQIENGIVRILQKVGEQFVAEARANVNVGGLFPKGNYKDHTANLRSSIGYFVLNNGIIVTENLYGNAEGESAAKSAMEKIPKSGYQLICVAGMDYASYVQSKGYNVIRVQQDFALVNAEKLLMQFRDRMQKKGKGFEFEGSDIVTGMYR